MARPKSVKVEAVDTEQAENSVATQEQPKVYTKVKNVQRAGKVVFGVTGKQIIFNDEGIADACGEDIMYLLTVPGYEGVE